MAKYRAVNFKKDQIAALYFGDFTMSDIVHYKITREQGGGKIETISDHVRFSET